MEIPLENNVQFQWVFKALQVYLFMRSKHLSGTQPHTHKYFVVWSTLNRSKKTLLLEYSSPQRLADKSDIANMPHVNIVAIM